jgi:LPXTG-motif cell wall-anchored protein
LVYKVVNSYINEVHNKLRDYAQQLRNESSNNSSTSSDSSSSSSSSSNSSSSSSSSGGVDSGYNSASEKTTYRDSPITCDYCGYTVKVDDPRRCWELKEKNKSFCSKSCGESWIRKEINQEEHEKFMKKIDQEIQEIKERGEKRRKEHEERIAKIAAEREENDKKWKQKMEKWDREREESGKNFDESLSREHKRFGINHVKEYCRIWKISDQQTFQLLGADWEQQINNASDWEEADQKIKDYVRVLENKKWIIELPEDKEKAIGDIEWSLDLWNVEDEQLNEELNLKDWREEINACSNQKEVERKKEQLKRKVKKISGSAKKKNSVRNLNYSQQNYVEKHLALPAGQSVSEYIRSAKTPKERKQREDEIRTILNKFEQENRKTGAISSIVGILLIGAIIGLIIYLVKRKKNKY